MKVQRILRLKPRLMPHQLEFVMDDKTPIQALVGGYRSGKSYAGTWKSLRCAVELFPGESGVMMSPIAGMNQTNIVPILREILPKTGLDYDHERLMSERCYRLDIKVGNKISSIYLDVSAENAKRMVGRSLAWGYFDEADVCRNADLAYDAFTQLKNRLSEAEHPLLFATSTPEGYGFMHRKFVEEKNEETRIWHVKMPDNFLLPKGYVESQLKNIPASKQPAYVNGEFANIYSSTVYKDFDRDLNNTDMTIEKAIQLGCTSLHGGMDFNIEHTSIILHVIIDGKPYAVHELVDQYDTDSACQALATLANKYKIRDVTVYPDASGKNRFAGGPDTSIATIKQYGFRVVVNPANPPVGDRVNSMNAMFHNGLGERRYKVNTRLCPVYTKCLERQSWKGAEPDKSNNIDHPLDAAGYFIYAKYPLQGKPTIRQR